MVEDVYKIVNSCVECCRTRGRNRHQWHLKQLPAHDPLEYATMDILGPLCQGHQLRTSSLLSLLTVILSLHLLYLYGRLQLHKLPDLYLQLVYALRPSQGLHDVKWTAIWEQMLQRSLQLLRFQAIENKLQSYTANGQTERCHKTIIAQLYQ